MVESSLLNPYCVPGTVLVPEIDDSGVRTDLLALGVSTELLRRSRLVTGEADVLLTRE